MAVYHIEHLNQLQTVVYYTNSILLLIKINKYSYILLNF